MYVRTTDYDRTHQSAQSQLAGWFPMSESYFGRDDLHWRPIAVHTVPLEEDTLLQAYDHRVFGSPTSAMSSAGSHDCTLHLRLHRRGLSAF